MIREELQGSDLDVSLHETHKPSITDIQLLDLFAKDQHLILESMHNKYAFWRYILFKKLLDSVICICKHRIWLKSPPIYVEGAMDCLSSNTSKVGEVKGMHLVRLVKFLNPLSHLFSDVWAEAKYPLKVAEEGQTIIQGGISSGLSSLIIFLDYLNAMERVK